MNLINNRYLALGDKAGRLILFEDFEHQKDKTANYVYMTEL